MIRTMRLPACFAIALVLLGLGLCGPVRAHPLAPALLELRELGGGRVAVVWKASLLTAPGAEVAPVLPAHCHAEGPPRATTDGDSVTRTWTEQCDAAGLVGEQVGFTGLATARIDALVRVTLADGRMIRAIVRAATPLLAIPARERRLDVVRAYGAIGVEHILGGVDHLFFVAGLVLLVRGRRQLIETLVAFTVGHSLTLCLAALDLLRLPERPIDLLIALSVFLLAVELAREDADPPSLLRRRPWVTALSFGLLHGLGLAAAWREVGTPPGEAALALLAFNVGIEIGQLAFVALLLSAVAALRALRVAWPIWLQRVPLYTMGSLAAFWCFERAAALVR